MKKYLLVFILLTLAPSLDAGGKGDVDYVLRGHDYFSAGDYKKALKDYEQAARFNPASAEAQRGMGKSYLKLGDNGVMTNPELLEKAVHAFNAALRISPDMADVRFDLGMAYLATHNREGALQEQKILQKLDPSLATRLSKAIESYRPFPAYREIGRRDEQESSLTKVTIDRNAVLVPVMLSLGYQTAHAVLLLDTGASVTTVTPDVASRLGVRLDQAPVGRVQVVGGAMIDARAVRLDKINVGPHTKTGLTVAVIEHKGPAVKHDGLLGMDFLRDLHYKIDFTNHVINWAP